MRNLIFSFFAILLFTACSNPDSGTVNAETETEAQPTTDNSQPKEYPFPIYTSFSQFEPHLHRDSDTTFVVNFWATWCKPCVAELPYFETLTEKYKDQKVKVVLVSLDFPKQLDKKLLPFVEEHNLQSEVIALFDGDYNSWIDKVNKDWEGDIPVTLIYNQSERKFIGKQFHDYEDLENSLKEVLNG